MAFLLPFLIINAIINIPFNLAEVLNELKIAFSLKIKVKILSTKLVNDEELFGF